MTQQTFLRWGLSGWLLSAFFSCWSQQPDSVKNYFINEVMISATRTEKKVLDVPKSVTVITKNDIKNSGAANLAELISSQENISVIGVRQNPGTNQSFFIRGSGSEHAVVMIDGIRITDPSSNSNAVDLSEISLIDVNRVEIVRGSHSTLYGSSAIGGVVNIITEKSLNPGFHVGANTNAGWFGHGTSQFNENLNLNYTFSNGFYLSGKVFRSDIKGLDAVIDTVKAEGVFKNNDRDDFVKTDLVSKIGYQNKKIDAFISYKNVDQHADADARAFVNDENYTVGLERQHINYSFRYKPNDKFAIWYNGGGSMVSRTNEDDSSLVAPGIFDRNFYTGTFEGTVLNNELQLDYNGNNIRIIIGGGIYRETMTSRSYTYAGAWSYESRTNLDSLDIHSDLSNLFISLDINGSAISEYLSSFSVMMGARYNSDNRNGRYVTWEFNPYCKISEKTMLFAGISTGFNAPPLYKLFTPESYYLSGISRGNPHLKPETSFSNEIGIKKMFGNNIMATLSAYRTTVKNSIQYVYLWDKNLNIEDLGNDWMRDDYRGDTYLNLAEMKTWGVEISLWANLFEKVTIRGNVNLQDSRLEYSSDNINADITQGNHVQLYENGIFLESDTSTNNLPRRSDNFNISFDYRFTNSTILGLSVNHISKKSDVFYSSYIMPMGALDTKMLKGYTLLNVSCRQQINKYLSVAARVQNVFNTKYNELIGYSTMGRGFFLNFDFSF
ncbi:MAG: TonB-dependent receptor [Bacteroidales bacterium]|nr:TonB-dependent receptor [Bacteroidales bacterium]